MFARTYLTYDYLHKSLRYRISAKIIVRWCKWVLDTNSLVLGNSKKELWRSRNEVFRVEAHTWYDKMDKVPCTYVEKDIGLRASNKWLFLGRYQWGGCRREGREKEWLVVGVETTPTRTMSSRPGLGKNLIMII